MTTAIAAWSITPAAAVATDELQEPETVRIGDRTFGPEDGLVVENGSVPLTRTSDGEVDPMDLTIKWRGTSYSSTEEDWQVRYTGKARAMGNLYGDQRVVRAGFKYTRDGEDLTGWVDSDSTACSPGPEVEESVNESIDPWAPVTKWRYRFSYVDSNLC